MGHDNYCGTLDQKYNAYQMGHDTYVTCRVPYPECFGTVCFEECGSGFKIWDTISGIVIVSQLVSIILLVQRPTIIIVSHFDGGT